MKRVIILGAGISGLSLGWFLKRRFGSRISLCLLEKSHRAGGWIETINSEGFFFEKGPRGVRPQGSGIETIKLLEQLKLENHLIVANQAACNRYLLMKNKLCPLPNKGMSCLLSPLTYKLVPAIFKDLFFPSRVHQEESIYQFFRRKFGVFAAENIVDPLVAGIFAGDIRQLSMKACFPDLYALNQEAGSLIKGKFFKKREKLNFSSAFAKELQKSPLVSLEGGMEELTQELASQLEESIIYQARVTALSCGKKEAIVELSNGQRFEAEHIISTLPAYAMAGLFEKVHQGLTKLFLKIPYVSIAVVNLGFWKKVCKKKGFGYLVGTKEKESILGVVFDSDLFPEQNQIPEETRLTVMIGEAKLTNFENYSEKDFLAIAKSAISRHLCIEDEPISAKVTIQRLAIPQYVLSHHERIAQIQQLLNRFFPRLTLHGSAFFGISVNDCIANSKRLEEQLS